MPNVVTMAVGVKLTVQGVIKIAFMEDQNQKQMLQEVL